MQLSCRVDVISTALQSVAVASSVASLGHRLYCVLALQAASLTRDKLARPMTQGDDALGAIVGGRDEMACIQTLNLTVYSLARTWNVLSWWDKRGSVETG